MIGTASRVPACTAGWSNQARTYWRRDPPLVTAARYRYRDFDTRTGTIDVAIPKLRSSSYFRDWLLARRKRAEVALISVVATCYLLGLPTRQMERLVETLGVTSLSKSQVSVMPASLMTKWRPFAPAHGMPGRKLLHHSPGRNSSAAT